MAATVQFGPFRFRTFADLEVLRAAFIAKEPAHGVTLVGSSIAGQSFQWSIGGNQMTDEEFGDALAAAYCSLGHDEFGTPPGNRTAARFC